MSLQDHNFPGVNGYTKDLDKRLPYDVDAAKKLLADAGYQRFRC